MPSVSPRDIRRATLAVLVLAAIPAIPRMRSRPSIEPLLPPPAAAQGPVDTAIVDAANQETLYRHFGYRFRIRFPAGWTVKPGDGPNVVQKAVSRGASVLVLVRDMTTPAGAADLQRRMQAAGHVLSVDEARTLARQEFHYDRLAPDDYPDARDSFSHFSAVDVLEEEMRRLDNVPARYSRVRMSYTAGERTVRAETYQYILAVEGRFYFVQAGLPLEDVETRRDTVERALRTFVLERW